MTTPNSLRYAEPVTQPLDLVAEAEHYAEFLWGQNDDPQNPAWYFAVDIDPNCVTDGKRFFIPDSEMPGFIREVHTVKDTGGHVLEIAGLTNPTSYRQLSPLAPGETATTSGAFIQYFWG